MEPKMPSTRDRILSMALILIREGGASSFTAAELVKRASISKGSLFHHFPSLDELAFAAGNRWREEIRSRREKCAEVADWSSFVRGYATWAHECWGHSGERWAFNFFEERALAQEKYRQLLNEIFADEEKFLLEQSRTKRSRLQESPSEGATAHEAWALGFAVSLRGLGRSYHLPVDTGSGPGLRNLFVDRWQS
jgi:AcrR family transcriptional regulator